MQESNTKKSLWAVLGVLCALAVVLIAAIVVVKNIGQGSTESDEESIPMEDVEIAYDVNDAAYDIVYKFENDPDYSLGNAEQDFGKLIEDTTDGGKIYATVAYANFLYDQTGDIERAVTLMETIEEDVPDDLKSGFYISFSSLYEKAGMDTEAEKYYVLAAELSKGISGL